MGQGLTTFLLAGLLTVPAVGYAVPLVYDEAVDGELGVPNQPAFEMGIGTNSVSGEVRFIAGVDIPVEEWQFDSDDFYFRVPLGSVISTITLSWRTTLEPATIRFVAGVNFLAFVEDAGDGPGPALVFQTTEYSFLSNQSAVQPFLGYIPPPTEADIFRLFMFTGAGVQAPVGEWGGGIVRYDWLVHVTDNATTAPEPGTLALLGLGLAGLGYLGLRRNRPAATQLGAGQR